MATLTPTSVALRCGPCGFELRGRGVDDRRCAHALWVAATPLDYGGLPGGWWVPVPLPPPAPHLFSPDARVTKRPCDSGKKFGPTRGRTGQDYACPRPLSQSKRGTPDCRLDILRKLPSSFTSRVPESSGVAHASPRPSAEDAKWGSPVFLESP